MPVVKHLLISGRVQGVGYRSWVCSQARTLGLNGWVRNLTDGRVEALVSGTTQSVGEMIKRCHQGPPVARVEKVEAEDSQETVAEGFRQLSTL